uniref:(northern house mosquito) hypothetical protein n=1 Tax=Culex pipiens TaxID=7175 RepID=A0A8D8AE44_CULPI
MNKKIGTHFFAKRNRYVAISPLRRLPLLFLHADWLNKPFPIILSERREIDVSKITSTQAHNFLTAEESTSSGSCRIRRDSRNFPRSTTWRGRRNGSGRRRNGTDYRCRPSRKNVRDRCGQAADPGMLRLTASRRGLRVDREPVPFGSSWLWLR